MIAKITSVLKKGVVATGIGVGALVLPSLAFADNVDSLTSIFGFIQSIQGILNVLLPLLVTLALLAFFWGLVQYLWAGGDAKQRDAGKGLMIWGVIALFVMVSIWGLVAVLDRLFLEGNMDTTATDYSGGNWRNGGGGGTTGGTTIAPPPPIP